MFVRIYNCPYRKATCEHMLVEIALTFIGMISFTTCIVCTWRAYVNCPALSQGACSWAGRHFQEADNFSSSYSCIASGTKFSPGNIFSATEENERGCNGVRSPLPGFVAVCMCYLWPPSVVDADIIFLPCGFFLSFCLFFSPNLSGRRLDVYHTLTHGVALVRI